MALWGKIDNANNKPKFANTSNVFLVSLEESLLSTNKAKGIFGPGWWQVDETTRQDGRTKYRAECLVAFSVANSVSGDAADDAVVADSEITITISAHPVAQTTVSGAATFTVSASASTGNATFQWQKATAANTARFVNVSGATANSLALTSQANTANGDVYRVRIGSDSGAVKVFSNPAVLTFGT